MKKKQQAPRLQTMIMKPTMGTAITTPRFTPEPPEGVEVASDILEGRRVSVKMRDGAMSKARPTPVL
jgi:predicted ATP-grasp superfamily ATP-dependent carboligase